MNISRLPLSLRKPLVALRTISAQFLLHRTLILAMALLQLAWLALIVLTGASTQYDRIIIVTVLSVFATGAILALPTNAIRELRDGKSWLLQSEKRVIWLLCLSALLIGLMYALRQTEWTDEQYSLKAAHIIASDGLVSAYSRVGWLGQQHPPLFSIIFAFLSKLPGPDMLFMRLVSVFFLAGTMVVTYFLGRELYSREIGFLAAVLLLSFPLVIRLSAAAMMDIQLAFFFSLGLLLLLRLSRKPSYWLACAAGIVIGLGLLTKYIMALLFVVIFFLFLTLEQFRKIKSHLFVATALAMAIFAIWISYANHMGMLARQFDKILSFVGSYHVVMNLEEATSPPPPETETAIEAESNALSDTLQDGIFRLGLESLFTRIPSSLGLYHLPLILFGLLYLIKKRNSSALILLLWIGGVSASLFLSLPDHRYFLPIFPAIAITIAHVLVRFPDYSERAILLSLLLGGSNLYLFANWLRESHIFLLTP